MAEYYEKIEATLRHCQDSGELVGFHFWDDEPSSFIVGSVLAVNNLSVTVAKVNSEAQHDGIAEYPLTEIIRIHVASQYLQGLTALMDAGSTLFERIDPQPYYGAGVLYEGLLKTAMNERKVVSLRDVSKEDLTGFITEVGDDYCVIEEIAEDGEPDGFYTVRLDDIKRATVSGMREQQRAFLYRNRMGT